MSAASYSPAAMVDRAHILSEIRRTAAANGGMPLGRSRFATETGIRESDWAGRYWARWSDAVSEAGLPPNVMTSRFDDDAVMEKLAAVVRRLGRLPTEPERRMERRSDPTFPSHGVFQRFGGQRAQAERLAAFCRGRESYEDVLELIEPVLRRPQRRWSQTAAVTQQMGDVYLLRVGRHYKIGRSNSFGRRQRELAIQLPVRATTVHVIKTDDPEGIEAYWHRRFADRRGNGEWFELTAEDVTAFKRRKFM